MLQEPFHVIAQLDNPDAHPNDREHMEKYGVYSVLFVALLVEGEPLGYVELWESRRKRDFTAEEIALTKAMTRQVSTNLYNARLHADIQANLRRTETLYYVAQSLIAPQSLQTLLHNTVHHITQTLKIDRVFIHLIDQEKEEIVHFIAGGPRSEQLRHLSYDTLKNSLIGWCLTQTQPAIVMKEMEVDARVDDVIIQLRREMNCGAIVVVPLLYQGKALGTLTAIHRPQDPNFSNEDVNLMTTMANQVAVAIANAQLRETEKHYAATLASQNEELNAFSHTVAHDLKNPLSTMMAQVGLFKELYQMGKHELIERRLDDLDYSGRLMSNIIDELLLLSQVRQTDVQTNSMDMDQIISHVLYRLQFDIDKAQAEITLPSEWPSALGYSGWVEEIWVNYITNAIKYGGQPPVIVLGADVGETAVTFWVQDNGPGISEEKQKQLFIPFERLEQTSIAGHGLGLSIVQRIANKLNGSVAVSSQEGQGSTFSFTLPRP